MPRCEIFDTGKIGDFGIYKNGYSVKAIRLAYKMNIIDREVR